MATRSFAYSSAPLRPVKEVCFVLFCFVFDSFVLADHGVLLKTSFRFLDAAVLPLLSFLLLTFHCIGPIWYFLTGRNSKYHFISFLFLLGKPLENLLVNTWIDMGYQSVLQNR